MTDKQKLLGYINMFHNDVEVRPGQIKFGEFRYVFNSDDELIQIQTIKRYDKSFSYKIVGKA